MEIGAMVGEIMDGAAMMVAAWRRRLRYSGRGRTGGRAQLRWCRRRRFSDGEVMVPCVARGAIAALSWRSSGLRCAAKRRCPGRYAGGSTVPARTRGHGRWCCWQCHIEGAAAVAAGQADDGHCIYKFGGRAELQFLPGFITGWFSDCVQRFTHSSRLAIIFLANTKRTKLPTHNTFSQPM